MKKERCWQEGFHLSASHSSTFQAETVKRNWLFQYTPYHETTKTDWTQLLTSVVITFPPSLLSPWISQEMDAGCKTWYQLSACASQNRASLVAASSRISWHSVPRKVPFHGGDSREQRALLFTTGVCRNLSNQALTDSSKQVETASEDLEAYENCRCF